MFLKTVLLVLCFFFVGGVLWVSAAALAPRPSPGAPVSLEAIEELRRVAEVHPEVAAQATWLWEVVLELDEGRRADAAEAAGTAAAAKAKVDVGSTELEEWEDSPEAYCGLILVPCCLCCYTIGATDMDDKIEGMEAAIKYITTNKDQNPGYYWSIQNFHYETRRETSTDANGNTTTHTTTVRVNTHFASTAGMLQANDVSETLSLIHI